MSDYIIGIDLGSSTVRATVGKLDNKENLQIVGNHEVKCSGLRKGIVVDIDKVSEAIRSCVGYLENLVNTSIDTAYVAIPGGICELLDNKGIVAITSENREISQKDIDRVHNSAGLVSVSSDKEKIGIVPKEYIIDGYDKIKDPVGMSGNRLEVDAQVVLAETSVMSNITKSIQNAGISVKGKCVRPNVISKSVLKPQEMSMGTLLLDVGAETIDLAIFKRDRLVSTSVIPFGGQNITNDISVCLQATLDEAESIKIKHGSLKTQVSDDEVIWNMPEGEITKLQLKQIIEARVDEMLEFIKKELSSMDEFEDVKNLVLVGGGLSFFDGVTTKCDERLGMHTRVGRTSFKEVEAPTYASAVGILIDAADTIKVKESTNKKEESKIIVQEKITVEEKATKNGGFTGKIKEIFADFF